LPGPQGELYPSGLSFRPFTVNEGLSQNLVSAIVQDHHGFIWVGTKDGLNMFDGYTFTVFRQDPFVPGSLGSNHITALYEDTSGRLWVGTLEAGLYLLNRETMRFTSFNSSPDGMISVNRNQIHAMIGDRLGNLWVATNSGGLYKFEFLSDESSLTPEDVRITSYDDKGFPETNAWINTLFSDRFGQLWVGTQAAIYVFDPAAENPVFHQVPFARGHIQRKAPAGARVFLEGRNGELWMGNMLGFFILDREARVFKPYRIPGSDYLTTPVHAASLYIKGDREEAWISSGHHLLVLDPLTGNLRHITYERYKSQGLQKDLYITLYADRGGGMWIGSNGHGLSLFDPDALKFSYPDEQITGSGNGITTVRDLSIRAFYQFEGQPEILWIGANQGLFKVNRSHGTMEAIPVFGARPAGERMVSSIRSDKNGMLWAGSAIGLVVLDPGSGTHHLYPTGLRDDDGRIDPRALFVYPEGDTIWVLTPNTIASFDKSTGRFVHFRYNDEPLDEYRDASFPFLLPDKEGNFWIGAKNGLLYFERNTGQFTTFFNDPPDSGSLSFNHILSILPDPLEPDRFLWVGTAGGGLNRFDVHTRRFRHFTTAEGLPNDMIYGIVADEAGQLWMSTNRGLSRFNPIRESFTNFTVSDGLQSNEFNSGAFYKSPAGELFFGGIQGYNSFFPSLIKQKKFSSPVVFTRFRLLVAPEDNGKATPLINITENSMVRLNHNQNHFTVEFASLDFANPNKNRFAYSLSAQAEGWIGIGAQAEKWIDLGTQRSVTFTDLKPGQYTLRVRGTNNDGIWSEQEAVATIVIASPWWKRPWMRVFYLILLAGAITLLRMYELSRIRLRNSIKFAHMETSKLIELNHLKSRFFANISHEFRTPLTLLRGPVEQMLEEKPDPKRRKTLKVMQANANRLMQLINQLLDLSRLESGEFPVTVRPGNISTFLKGVVMSFASLAETKKINLHYEESPEIHDKDVAENFLFDRDILEKILNNLLSNAFKFTPEKGRVVVAVCIHTAENGDRSLELAVADTGIGIPGDKLPFIYDRFYQVDPSAKREQEGTGVGLAYVKELVRVHRGSIIVKSQEGEGATFSLRFPIGKDHFSPHQIRDLPAIDGDGDTLHGGTGLSDKGVAGKGKPLVLIVEDQADVRHYIAECLEGEYRTIEASGATEGLALAAFGIPDLIISDVMMPKMDGYEFCARIKSDEKTSHIPVILLTALAGEEDRVTGLETGADDYLTKPFNPKELRVRVKNLIETRNALRLRFSETSMIRASEVSVTSRDKAFIEKALSVVEQNIANEHFSVDQLGSEIGMSQSQLHRKFKALINQSPVHFIRSVRMHRAMELLQKDAGNISEIAFMTGYDDPGYFTRTFKAFFHKLPSEVQKKSSRIFPEKWPASPNK
jgi:signal transduction histidine kinase/ligand-binding sensor domain-containing protein/DNA-binding response OmpR family regulator